MNTILIRLTAFALLGSSLLAGCNNVVVTNTPMPKMTDEVMSTSIAMSEVTSTSTMSANISTAPTGKGNLIVIVWAGSQPTLNYQSDVYVFSNDQLVKKGKTEKGIFPVQIDSGSYDVVIVYSGQPLLGQIQRAIAIEPDKQNIVTFSLPAEGKLDVKILTKSGKPALKTAYVTILSGDQEIFKDLSSTSSLMLRTGYVYSVTVKYGSTTAPSMTFTDEVKITSDQVVEKDFTLPHDETKLLVKVVSGTENVYSFNIVVTDADAGTTIYTGLYSTTGIILESGKNYVIQVTSKGSVQEKSIKAGDGDLELTFKYP